MTKFYDKEQLKKFESGIELKMTSRKNKMTNEIKKIEEELAKISFSNIGHYVNTNLILDYITNLQEENEKLKKIKKEQQEQMNELRELFIKDEHKLLNDNQVLQQRIDKAIEVIDLITPELWNISNKMTYRLKDVKNILRGDE